MTMATDENSRASYISIIELPVGDRLTLTEFRCRCLQAKPPVHNVNFGIDSILMKKKI